MLRTIALLLLIPLLDALLLVFLVPFLGWKLVVLLVVLTALLGMFLVRLEGRHTLAKIQRKLAKGEAPTNEVIDGGLLIAAGAFLLTPGLVTDTLGFLFVIPITRYPIRWALKRWVIVPYMDKQTGGLTSGKVYIGGFPPTEAEPEGSATGGPGDQEPSESGPASDFEDVQDVDFEEVDDGDMGEE